jgi:hypothetical protein
MLLRSSSRTLRYCETHPRESRPTPHALDRATHEYARSFGTPCFIYDIDGVRITVKSTSHGSRYDPDGICNDCFYYPCHEGLYDMFLLPDGRLCGCRWSATSVIAADDFIKALNDLSRIFQRADWHLPEQVLDMPPYPDFIKFK